MTISRMLGATMVAGALATGGAAAGIASASASPTTQNTAATTATSTQSSTPSTSTTRDDHDAAGHNHDADRPEIGLDERETRAPTWAPARAGAPTRARELRAPAAWRKRQ